MTNEIIGLRLKEWILQLLSEEPNLSTSQIARITGQKLNTVQKALNHLRDKSKLIKSQRLKMWDSYLWKLKNSKSLNEINYRHEVACADVYVALKSTGQELIWISKDDQKKGFRFDRAFEIFGRKFFLELETGTHFDKRFEVIPKKIESYLKLEGYFHVIFCVMDFDDRVTFKRYGQEILNIISEYRRNAQFLITPHSAFIQDPLGRRLIHPSQELYALNTLPSDVHSASIREESHPAVT